MVWSPSAENLANLLRGALPSEQIFVTQEESFAGGGSLPAWPMQTAVVRWTPSGNKNVDEVARRLRMGDPAVLVRIKDDAILLDARTILDAELPDLKSAITAVLGSR